MSRAVRHSHYTFAAYVEQEAQGDGRHAFLDGQIYPIVGGTPEQAALAAAVGGALVRQLAGKPCRVYGSELRVSVPATSLVTYPDVSVVWDPLERDARDHDTALNPVVLVEVTGTLTYEHSDILGHLKQIASVREILVVSHRGPWIECWSREEGPWRLIESRTGQQVVLRSIGCTLDVNAIYASSVTPTSSIAETRPRPWSC